MRTLFVSALGLTLVGCASLADPDLNIAQTPATFTVGSAPQYEPDLTANASVFKVGGRTGESVQSTLRTRSSPGLDKKTKAAGAKQILARKVAPLPATQPKDKTDPIIEKAKASIAAMFERPESAEFYNLRRATKLCCTVLMMRFAAT